MNKKERDLLANRLRQAAWYARQKNHGIIYRVLNVVTGDLYVGRTNSSLKKRMQRHIADANAGRKLLIHTNIREWGKECFEISELQVCSEEDDTKELEKKWISEINPNLNVQFKDNY